MCCGASALFAEEHIYDLLEKVSIKTSMTEFTVQEIVDLLRDEETRFTLIQDFMGMATRTFIKEFGIYWEEFHPRIVPITFIKNQIQFLSQEIDKIKSHLDQSIEEYLEPASSISKMIY